MTEYFSAEYAPVITETGMIEEEKVLAAKPMDVEELKKVKNMGFSDEDLECGIKNRPSDEEQIKNIANKYKKTVVIHSRDAHQDTYNILKEYKNIKGVLHCYSGSLELAREYIKMGYMLGIGGVLTFKNSRKLVEIVKEIPLEYLLLETDSPYLSPEPFRGKTNYPNYIEYVARKIAEIKEISYEEVIEITTDNAARQFDLNI